MKPNQLLTLTILITVLISSFKSPPTLAHEYCESYLDCHQEPEDLEKVDYWTNYFFKLLRPEMRNKQIRIHHTLYRRERAEIRRVVNKVVYQSCQQPNLEHYYLLSDREQAREKREPWQSLDRQARMRKELRDNRDDYWHKSDYGDDDELLWDEELWDEGYYWDRSNDYFFEGLYHDLTDAVFYARHPELSAHLSRRDTMNWSSEWTFIRQQFADFEQEKFLKQHLIPICERHQSLYN
ncbi:MAG: hypothetical protein RLZZ04_1617 [Cyanobacteriota bacterium]|jgi:hypothetical protein